MERKVRVGEGMEKELFNNLPNLYSIEVRSSKSSQNILAYTETYLKDTQNF